MSWSGSRAGRSRTERSTVMLGLGAAAAVVTLVLVTVLTRGGGEEPMGLTVTQPTQSPALPTPAFPSPALTALPSASVSATPSATATRRPAPSTTARRAPGAAVPMAVYRAAGGWGANQIGTYEKFIGGKMAYALDFQATDTWDNQSWPAWQADAWKKSGRTVILGATGIFPGDYNRNFNGQKVGWAQAASGDYDAHWRKLGERLVSTGQKNAILRGAHEFNGSWFPHRVERSEAEDFKKAWRRWVGIMRAVPGNNFTFDWNPTLGQEALRNPEVAYPGDAYVDRIALDVYDGWYNRGWTPGVDPQPSEAERDKVWNEMLHGERGLIFWKNFAKSHGKPLSFPEWGIRVWTESADKKVHGGGDNPKFIERMHAIITDPSWNVDYHAFWEDPGQGVSDADTSKRAVPVPKSRATFLRLFGQR